MHVHLARDPALHLDTVFFSVDYCRTHFGGSILVRCERGCQLGSSLIALLIFLYMSCSLISYLMRAISRQQLTLASEQEIQVTERLPRIDPLSIRFVDPDERYGTEESPNTNLGMHRLSSCRDPSSEYCVSPVNEVGMRLICQMAGGSWLESQENEEGKAKIKCAKQLDESPMGILISYLSISGERRVSSSYVCICRRLPVTSHNLEEDQILDISASWQLSGRSGSWI